MGWFRRNIKWFGPTVAMFVMLSGLVAGKIPVPAKASDLEALDKKTQANFDKMTSAIQTLAEIQATAAIDSEISNKQSEIRAIKRDFASKHESVSQESQIIIDTLDDEVEELRWQRDNLK